MRFLTLILTTTILFLAVKPGIDLISVNNVSEVMCCEGSCSSNTESDKSSDTKKENNDCSGKLCNPFQTCGCCLLFLNAQEIQEINIQDPNFKKQFFSHYSGFNSQFTPDFWQPPKIA
jgi:hypothetical protein